MTWTSANRMCRWVGLAQKATADRCGWGLGGAGGGLGSEEIPAGRSLAEPALFVRFGLCGVCARRSSGGGQVAVYIKPTKHVGRSAVF